jgi:hypothetical protein
VAASDVPESIFGAAACALPTEYGVSAHRFFKVRDLCTRLSEFQGSYSTRLSGFRASFSTVAVYRNWLKVLRSFIESCRSETSHAGTFQRLRENTGPHDRLAAGGDVVALFGRRDQSAAKVSQRYQRRVGGHPR